MPPTRAQRRDPAYRPKLVGLQVGADYLDCSTRALRNWIAAGKLTGWRVGRHLKVDLHEIHDFAQPVTGAAGQVDQLTRRIPAG